MKIILIKEKSINFLFIEKAIFIGDFIIRVFFNNGDEKAVDFKPFLKKSMHIITKKYLDENKFKNFKIVNGNLNWNDYELIFPIYDLYKNQILKKTK